MAEQQPIENELRRLIAKVVNAKCAKGPRGAIEAYEGEVYFVSDWVDADTPFEKAVEGVQDPKALYLMLLIHGLEYILADRHAATGLKKGLLQNNRLVRRGLEKYLSSTKPKGKPGPRPKDGSYKSDIALELRSRKLTFGQIARELYGDPGKRNAASALVAQAKKKQAKVGNTPSDAR